jgi:hypothetical protein
MTESNVPPGLARLRWSDAAEAIRRAILADQERALRSGGSLGASGGWLA